MKKTLLLFGLLLAGQVRGDEGFDVNDVSILLPKGAPPFVKPYPAVDGTGVLPAPVLADLIAYGEGEQYPNGARSSQRSRLVLHRAARASGGWYVHSLRVDDCAPQAGQHGAIAENGATDRCEFQLRLVLQPVEEMTSENSGHLILGLLPNTKGGEDRDDFPSNGSLVATDNALHLIYSVAGTSAQKDLLDGLRRIKARSPVKTAGLPLGVHPGLAAELRAGGTELGDRLRELLARHALPERLRKVTFFGPTNRVWVFFAGLVSRDTAGAFHWSAIPLENAGNGRFQIATINLSAPSFPEPTPVNPDRASREDTRRAQPFTAETDPAKKAKSVHAVAAMLNPYRVHAENIDCVSCHLAGLDLFRLTEQHKQAGLLAALSDPAAPAVARGVTPFHSFAKEVLTGYTQITNWNLRAFGWYFGSPTVSFRTVTESVRVASSLNRRYQWEAPAKGCASREKYAATIEKLGATHAYGDEPGLVRECE